MKTAYAKVMTILGKIHDGESLLPHQLKLVEIAVKSHIDQPEEADFEGLS